MCIGGQIMIAAAAQRVPLIMMLVLDPGYVSLRMGPWFPIAFVPLAVALATAWRAASRTSGAAGALAAATVALSATWMVVLALEVARYPVVATLLAAAGLLAVVASRLRRLLPPPVPSVARQA